MQALTKVEQNRSTEFVPDEIIYFAVGNQYYDEVYKWTHKLFTDKGKKENYEWKQANDNIG
jgi:hypothetical protein